MTKYIKTENLLLQPAWLDGNDRSAEFAAAIHQAGEFELYFGFPETKYFLDELFIARPMYHNILDKNGSFIGYIGFHPEDTGYEFEIYILTPYRKKGYAKEALYAAIRAVFNGDIDGMEKCERIIAAVRVENTVSQALVKSVGFAEDKDIPFCLGVFLTDSENNYTIQLEDNCTIQLVFYYLTKEMFTKK